MPATGGFPLCNWNVPCVVVSGHGLSRLMGGITVGIGADVAVGSGVAVEVGIGVCDGEYVGVMVGGRVTVGGCVGVDVRVGVRVVGTRVGIAVNVGVIVGGGDVVGVGVVLSLHCSSRNTKPTISARKKSPVQQISSHRALRNLSRSGVCCITSWV